MARRAFPSVVPVPNLSATGPVVQGDGNLVGFFVASSTSGTVKLWDSTSAAGTIILQTTGTLAVGWYPMPASFTNGVYLTVGGTINVTVVYER